MLRHIEIKSAAHQHAVGIIKKDDLIKFRAANDVINAAQRQAKKTVIDAQTAADDMTNAAWTEGYIAGIKVCVQDFARFVNDHDSHKNAIMSGVLSALTVKLEDFFTHDDVICQLLNALAAQFSQELLEPAVISVALPEKIQPASRRVKDIFTAAGLQCEVKKSRTDAISVEFGNTIWTCDLPVITDKMTRAAIKDKMLSCSLQEQCHASSVTALKNIRDTLSAYLDDIEQPDNM
nr:hypothetical protein [uncultured Enterobacter sp.]